jgi:N-acetylglucosaminyldiphosphoundecaprenol N-acetyl-beta-D-mannosaminyltransferase
VRSVNVRGTAVAAVSSVDQVVARIEQSIEKRDRRRAVYFANVHLIEAARRDPAVARALAGAELVVPDGAPVAWAMRRLGAPHVRRVTGSDVFDAVCARGHSHFFLGSSSETLALLVWRLRSRHPGFRIAGMYAPTFQPLDAMDLAEPAARIEDAAPDILWVGLGAPKQELWIERARELVTVPVMCAVGAVFDFASGTKRRAPEAVQRAGFEWAFRLAVEPRRLTGRYLVTNARFLAGLPGVLANREYR